MRRRVESARWIAGRSLALATIAGVAVCSAGCSPQSAAPASPNTAVPQSATVVVPATFIYEDGAGKQPADTTANQAPAPAGREQPVPTPATPANTVTASRAVRPPSLPPEPPPAASPTPAIIRNADLIRLARNGTTESEIVRLLTSSRSELDTSIPALVQLKNEGVSDAIINAMLASSRTAAPALLRNADVVQMVRSGQPDAAVIATIRRSKAEFDVSISGLVALKKDGVSDAVIEAVLAAMKKP